MFGASAFPLEIASHPRDTRRDVRVNEKLPSWLVEDAATRHDTKRRNATRPLRADLRHRRFGGAVDRKTKLIIYVAVLWTTVFRFASALG